MKALARSVACSFVTSISTQRQAEASRMCGIASRQLLAIPLGTVQFRNAIPYTPAPIIEIVPSIQRVTPIIIANLVAPLGMYR